MDWLTHVFTAIKSPKTAIILLLSSAAFLFVPFDKLEIDQPSFTTEYEAVILVIFVFSASIVTIEIASRIWHIMGAPFRAIRRKRRAVETFRSLNLNELCVLWAIAQQGMRTVRAGYNNPIMVSMRHKGALYPIATTASITEFPHAMPEQLYKLVRKHGADSFPNDFKNSPRFEDEVRRMFHEATDWRI